MILLVDDEAENISSLKAVLEKEGWPCREANSAADALQILREDVSIRLLITDLKMPGAMDGLELLESARLVRPDVQRLLVTAFGTVESTVAAMRSGAFDVLPKPLKLKQVRETVAKLLERAGPHVSARGETPSLSQHQVSPEYAAVMELIRRAAPTQASVLFCGESGTGKSYLSKVLHQSSDRREEPFIALNCAAIPADLLESELFGFEKGAFTGAVASRDGKILAANKGTLLLDEIADLSPALQAKLLHFIQERKFFKLGSNKEISADVRLLAATNRNLDELVRTGGFREDLLYRLKVVEIRVPALRERKSDLLWIVPALLDALCERHKRPPLRLTHGALSKIWAYDWPGNIRELENSLESALVLAPPEELREGFLTERAFSSARFSGTEAVRLPPLPDLATLERQAIEQALVMTQGNRRLAAQLLGISERTLYRALSSSI